MAFSVPTFNLTARVWRFYAGPYTSVHPGGVDTPCNLRMLKTAAMVNSISLNEPTMLLLVPKGTDIRGRDGFGNGNGDIVEVPKGTGRFYELTFVDDVARGFTNEYRVGCASQAQSIAPVP